MKTLAIAILFICFTISTAFAGACADLIARSNKLTTPTVETTSQKLHRMFPVQTSHKWDAIDRARVQKWNEESDLDFQHFCESCLGYKGENHFPQPWILKENK
jgi:hypothetical protein